MLRTTIHVYCFSQISRKLSNFAVLQQTQRWRTHFHHSALCWSCELPNTHSPALTSRNPLLFTTPQSSIIVVAFPLLYTTGDLRDSGVSGEEQGHPQAGRVSVTENLREPHSPGPVPDSVVSHRRSVSGIHRQQGATECHSTLQSQGTSNGRYIIHHCKYHIILLQYPKC